MEDIAGKITLYHNLFLVFFVLFLVFLALTIALFFLLHIPEVLGYLTGRRAKKQIQQLEEENAASGRLIHGERANMQYVDQKMKDDMGVKINNSPAPGVRKVDHVITDPSEKVNYPEIVNESETTTLSGIGESETTTLTVDQNKDSTRSSSSHSKVGTFKMEREIILIHAEEII